MRGSAPKCAIRSRLWVACALLSLATEACTERAGAPKTGQGATDAHGATGSKPQEEAHDSAADAGSPRMSAPSMAAPAMNTGGSKDGMGFPPEMGFQPELCTSDAQCRMQAEQALGVLSDSRVVRRRIVQATCTLNPCTASRPRPICGCVLGPDDGRALESYTLGSVGPCAVVGRGSNCLVRKDEYETCDTQVASSCDAQCEHVADVMDADEARARQVEVRYASCNAVGSCMTVFRIDDACYFDFSPTTIEAQSGPEFLIPEQTWDCSLSDAEIVSKYYPTTDWEALGCSVSPTTITCKSQGPGGGCYLHPCLDPACYPDAGLDAGGAECSCSSEEAADLDAGSR